MKNPSHPGDLVKANLEELGLTTAEAAQKLGVTRQQLHKVMMGQSRVSPEMSIRLEKGFGGAADMWLRLQANYDAAQAQKRASRIKVSRIGAKTAA